MTRTEYKEANRNARIAARRARKQNRNTAWQRWARGMALLRQILREEKAKLQAMADADWHTARLTVKAD